jgi:hypothetical protein
MSEDSISRRGFIGGAVASTLAAKVAPSADRESLPTRVLGRTGQRVPILALGCGSRLSMYGTQDKGVERKGCDRLPGRYPGWKTRRRSPHRPQAPLPS